MYLCSVLSLMDRFLGNIESKIDVKGRAFLPANFRKILQDNGEERIALRMHIDEPCLVLYPISVWKERVDAIKANVNMFDNESEKLFRVFVSEAVELTLDGNGRFLIPKFLLEDAEIKQSVKFLGVDETIEIWASEKLTKPFFTKNEFSMKIKALMAKQ